MARPLRIEFPGAIYHVTARGNERRPIFRSKSDRRRFLTKLAVLATAHKVRVYAFVQMTNHYHLVVCTPRGNLCAFMQQFQTSYTMYFNRRHDRIGHLFAGRYKAKLVEGGGYLLRLSRYVHLNPVNAAKARDLPLVERREWLNEYPWSSYHGYAGLSAPLPWMCYEALTAFGGEPGEDRRRDLYRQFVEEALDDGDDALAATLTRSSKAFGSEAFCRQIESRFRERTLKLDRFIDISMRRTEAPVPVVEVTAAVLQAYNADESDLVKRGNREVKDVWMRLLHEHGGLTQRQIGELIGHGDGASVSRRLSRLTEELKTNSYLVRRCNDLRSAITNDKA